MPTVSELTVKVDADISGVTKGLDQANKEVEGFGSSITKGLGVGLGFGAISTAIGLVGSAFSAAKGSIIDLNGSLEQSQIAFTTMLGSGEKAEGFLKELQTFAANTPFEFPDLVSASKRMLAFGFSSQQVVPLLTAVGDAVAAVGGGAETIDGVTTALGQMQAKGKVSAEEMGQLAERGIPAWDMLAKKLGVSVADAMDMVSKGQVKAGVMIEAFQEESATRFGGMMEKQSATWSGALSTISDSLTMATAKAFKPFFELISQGAVQLSKMVQSDMFNAWADAAARNIGIVVNALRSLFEIFMGGPDAPFIEAREALDTFFPASVTDRIVDIANDLGGAFDAVFAGDIPDALGATTLVVEDFGGLLADSVEAWASAIVDWVAGASPDLLSELGDMAVDMQGWVLDSGIALVEKLATWAAAFIDWVAPMIPPFLREMGAYLVKMTGWLINDGLPTIISKLGEWGLAFVAWVAPRIPPLLEALGGLLLELGTWIITTALPAIAGKLLEWGDAFTAWVMPKIPPLLVELGKLSLQVLGWMTGTALPAIVEKLVEWGGAFLGWVAKDVLPSLPEKLGAIMTAIGGWISEKVGSVSEGAKQLGVSFIRGIQDGIASALDGFWRWLQTNFVDRIPSFVRELLNIHSPSGVFADIGRSIVDGLRVGMQQRLPSIDDLVSRLVGRIATTGEVTDWLQTAMRLTGKGGDWLSGLQRLAFLESTNDPRAVNPVEVAGQHATGLLQTLPSTFRAYRLADLPNDIFNPIANAAAAIRYISSTYGHVNAIPGLYGAFKGYAEGGVAWRPQLAMVAEREPEAIIPKSWFGQAGTARRDSMTLNIAIGGQVARQIVVEGYDLAVKRGWTPGGLTG